MFEQNKTFLSFSVNDQDSALHFYRDVLKLTVSEMEYGLEVKTHGAGTIFIYPKETHQAATFTLLNFVVADIDAAVKALKVKEVNFESYHSPPLITDENNICNMPEMNMKQAWFRDPAGNIHSLIQQVNSGA